MRIIQSPFFSETIAEGVQFHAFRDDRFKTNRLSVHLVVPLMKETASLNALLPKVLRRGCKKYPNYILLSRKLDNSYGAYIEAGAQKRGDNQIITISITAIDDKFAFGEAVCLPTAELLCDLIFNPVIEKNELNPRYLEAEKKSLCDAIDSLLNDKRSYALMRALQILCKDDPAGIPAFGEKEEIILCSASDLVRKYLELIRIADVHIMFTGCGDYFPVLKLFNTVFSFQKRNLVQTKSKPLKGKETIATVEEEMDLLQAKLVLGYTGNITGSSAHLPAMRIAVSILGGTPMSKLFMNVREKESLCYYCSARYDIYKGTMLIDCGVEPENIEKAIESISNQVSLLQEGAFTDQEIEYAVLSLKNAYQSIYESDVSVESFFLNQILSGNDSGPEEQKALLSTTTREDILQAAQNLSQQLVYLLNGKRGETH